MSMDDIVVPSSQYDTTLRLTLILLLLYGPPGQAVPIPVLCALPLVIPAILRNRYVWWSIAWFVGIVVVRDWTTVDNHQYLMAYWVLGCALSVGMGSEAAGRLFLRRTARSLVGIVFLFATLWKLWGGQYIDGSFLHFTFLLDGRFRYVAAFLVDRSPDELVVASEALRYLAPYGTSPLPTLQTAPALATFTLALSWAGLCVEGTVAAVHFCPGRRLQMARLTLLWGFIASTFFLFPVLGFGLVLAILGYAQCEDDQSRWQLAFLVLCGLLYLTLLPWGLLLPG